MQIQVVAGTATPYGNLPALTTALAAVYNASQPAHSFLRWRTARP